MGRKIPKIAWPTKQIANKFVYAGMKPSHTAFLSLVVLFNTSVFCQTKPEFEVASIKPAAPITSGQQMNFGVRIDDAQARFTFFSLKDLIQIAYKVKGYQISGPDWASSERFDISATIPAGVKRDQLPEMLQALLAERFQLKLHRTEKEFPVYGLVVAKGGSKMKEAALETGDEAAETAKKPFSVTGSGGRAGTVVNFGDGSYFALGNNRFEAKKLTMVNVAETLARFTDRPVVDMTTLKGIYDFQLEFQPDDFQAMMIRSAIAAGVTLPPQAIQLMERASGDSLPNALQTIGLKLEPRKAPLEVLVIDNLQKVPTVN